MCNDQKHLTKRAAQSPRISNNYLWQKKNKRNKTFYCALTWAGPATWPTMATSWHRSHCHECEAAARQGLALPPCWPQALAAGPTATQRWPSRCPRPRCGSGTSGPARWCSAAHHLREVRARRCSGFWRDVWDVAQLVQWECSPLLIRPSLDKQPCGWTLVTKIGSSPLLLPRPPATVMPRDSCGSFFTVMCFSLQVTHWDRSCEWSKGGNANKNTCSL